MSKAWLELEGWDLTLQLYFFSKCLRLCPFGFLPHIVRVLHKGYEQHNVQVFDTLAVVYPRNLRHNARVLHLFAKKRIIHLLLPHLP